jgi:hypothetical protein
MKYTSTNIRKETFYSHFNNAVNNLLYLARVILNI